MNSGTTAEQGYRWGRGARRVVMVNGEVIGL